MSSPLDEQIARQLVRGRELIPDYSLVPKETYKATDLEMMTLFKIWRQGNLMQDLYGRRSYFYRAPNWLLIWQTGPTSEIRKYFDKTLRALRSLYYAPRLK